jgi:hypothetical protein
MPTPRVGLAAGTGGLTPDDDDDGELIVDFGDGRSTSALPGETLRVEPPVGSAAVDVCFVFDTTGSMSDKIDGLITCLSDFVRDLAVLDLDWRVTAVPFGDLTVPGDRVVGDVPFEANATSAVRMLATMPRFHGGVNEGESSADAMITALGKPYRQGAVKILVLLTDEPALESPAASFDLVGARLRSSGTLCFVASPDHPYFRDWAIRNGGAWYLIGQSMETSRLLALLRGLLKLLPQLLLLLFFHIFYFLVKL